MKARLAETQALMRAALRRMFESRLSGTLNILVIGIAFSLPTGMYVVLNSLQALTASLSDTPQISLFMARVMDDQGLAQVRTQLSTHAGIAQVTFIGKDQALAALQERSGIAELVAGLDDNPLPDTFVVTPRTPQPEALTALRDELARIPGVELAQLDAEWAEKLAALTRFARFMVLILASLLSLATLAITFNTIRLQILTQREEIEVSRLIGATDGFISRPFLLFGALQGLLGGIAAWGIVALSLLELNSALTPLAHLYDGTLVLRPLSIWDSVSLLLFALYLGWLGAWLSVSRHLARAADAG